MIVGQSLDDRDETLAGLVTSFAVGGPIAVLIASLVGYALAAAGLRPIEAMRRRAGEISLGDDDDRLPLPAAHDEVHRLGTTLNEMLERLHGLARARAALRGRRQPRAADARRGDQDRARGRVASRRARSAGARGARRRRRGVRQPGAARGGPARRGADRDGSACRCAASRSPRRPCSRACAGASPTVRASAGVRSSSTSRPDLAAVRRRPAPAPGTRQPGRQRAAPRRGRDPSARAPPRTAAWRSRCRTPGRVSAGHRGARLRALRPQRRRPRTRRHRARARDRAHDRRGPRGTGGDRPGRGRHGAHLAPSAGSQRGGRSFAIVSRRPKGGRP